MSSLTTLSVLFSTFISTYLLSGQVRKNAVCLQLIDIPNERSSHTTPVPRGGGIAVAAVFLLCLTVVHSLYFTLTPLFLSLLLAGGLIALVGFLDDRKHIPVRIRLVAHFSAAFLVVYLDYLYPVINHTAPSAWLWVVILFLAVCLVWLLNLYNFMDGIDAITSVETLTITLLAAWFSWQLLPSEPSWLILLILSACVLGFLPWNLPPAKLFMGDSGSAFLGIVLGCFIVHALQHSTTLFYVWIILLGVYIVDATITLLRRILTGEKFYQAHRTHAYQHAAIRHQSHGTVSLAIGGINLLWLAPMALAVTSGKLSGPLAILIAYAPLVILAFAYHAGLHQPHQQAN